MRPIRIPVPGLTRPLGLGDAVKTVTAALRVPSCSPCQQRAERLNALVVLTQFAQPQEPPHGDH